MAIIYTYPVKTSPAADDLILISDSADSKKTKQIKVSSLPSSGSGITLTTTGTSGVATLTGTVLNIPNYTTSGGTISVQGAGGTPITGITTLNFRHNFAVGAVGTTATMDVLPYGNDTEIQFKNGDYFGASSNLTYGSDTLTVQDNIIIKGDGSADASKLRFNCWNNNHYVDVIGPDHTNSPLSYSITLPNKIAPQSAVSGGRVLEVNASGVGNWIDTPTGGGSPAGSNNQFQYNNNSAFAGSSMLVLGTDEIVIGDTPSEQGKLRIEGSETVSGNIKIEGTTATRGVNLTVQTGITSDYNVVFPDTGPGGNNKILESDSSGNLAWIATPSGGSGISFNGTTANGIATYSNSTTAAVSSVFTVSGNKLSAPSGTLADPSIEVGAIGGLYAASGGILLAHNGANAIGVTSSSTVNYKLTQFNAGLKFGATGETLNSYEEGTWTPTSANANTISSAVGDYTRIGDMVFAQFSFTMTGSTTVAISALPFQGVYTSSLKGGVIISADSCTSVQGQLKGGQFTGTNSFTFNSYFGSGGGLPTQLRQVTSSMYQTSGGTYAGIIIYETTA